MRHDRRLRAQPNTCATLSPRGLEAHKGISAATKSTNATTKSPVGTRGQVDLPVGTREEEMWLQENQRRIAALRSASNLRHLGWEHASYATAAASATGDRGGGGAGSQQQELQTGPTRLIRRNVDPDSRGVPHRPRGGYYATVHPDGTVTTSASSDSDASSYRSFTEEDDETSDYSSLYSSDDSMDSELQRRGRQHPRRAETASGRAGDAPASRRSHPPPPAWAIDVSDMRSAPRQQAASHRGTSRDGRQGATGGTPTRIPTRAVTDSVRRTTQPANGLTRAASSPSMRSAMPTKVSTATPPPPPHPAGSQLLAALSPATSGAAVVSDAPKPNDLQELVSLLRQVVVGQQQPQGTQQTPDSTATPSTAREQEVIRSTKPVAAGVADGKKGVPTDLVDGSSKFFTYIVSSPDGGGKQRKQTQPNSLRSEKRARSATKHDRHHDDDDIDEPLIQVSEDAGGAATSQSPRLAHVTAVPMSPLQSRDVPRQQAAVAAATSGSETGGGQPRRILHLGDLQLAPSNDSGNTTIDPSTEVLLVPRLVLDRMVEALGRHHVRVIYRAVKPAWPSSAARSSAAVSRPAPLEPQEFLRVRRSRNGEPSSNTGHSESASYDDGGELQEGGMDERHNHSGGADRLRSRVPTPKRQQRSLFTEGTSPPAASVAAHAASPNEIVSPINPRRHQQQPQPQQRHDDAAGPELASTYEPSTRSSQRVLFPGDQRLPHQQQSDQGGAPAPAPQRYHLDPSDPPPAPHSYVPQARSTPASSQSVGSTTTRPGQVRPQPTVAPLPTRQPDGQHQPRTTFGAAASTPQPGATAAGPSPPPSSSSSSRVQPQPTATQLPMPAPAVVPTHDDRSQPTSPGKKIALPAFVRAASPAPTVVAGDNLTTTTTTTSERSATASPSASVGRAPSVLPGGKRTARAPPKLLPNSPGVRVVSFVSAK